ERRDWPLSKVEADQRHRRSTRARSRRVKRRRVAARGDVQRRATVCTNHANRCAMGGTTWLASLARPRDVVLVEAIDERAQRNPELLGRALLIAGTGGERVDDALALDGVELAPQRCAGIGWHSRGYSAGTGQLGRQILGQDPL